MLRLTSLQPKDSGYYKCSSPGDTKSDVVRLNVLNHTSNSYELHADILKKSIEIRERTVIYQVCTCKCSGLINQYALKITWHDRMGKLIKNDSDSTINTVLIRQNPITKVSIIKFSKLNSKDTGVLSCVCQTGLKIDTVDFELRQSEKITELKYNKRTIEKF